MANPRPNESDYLYIEELSANESEGVRLTGISLTDTVESLKRRIALHNGNVQDWNNISLAFASYALSDSDATLNSYGIVRGDTIYFSRSIASRPGTPSVSRRGSFSRSQHRELDNVMFRDLDGKTLILHQIPTNWLVSQLIAKLGDEKAIEVSYYRFIWSGKQLELDKSLNDYALHDNATIHMVLRLRGGRN